MKRTRPSRVTNHSAILKRRVEKAAPLGAMLVLCSTLVLSLPSIAAGADPQRLVAVTVDDLPMAGTPTLAEAQAATQAILAALRAHGAPAIGFVNEDKLLVPGEVDARISILEAWVDAGMELGNHNFGHVGFQKTPLDQYEEAVLKGEVVTRWLLAQRGRVPRFYRHPYTQTGPTAFDKTAFESFLREHGYTVAPFTIEYDDFIFAAVYEAAIRRGEDDEVSRTRDAYVAHLDAAVDAFESMAEDLFGRAIPHVLLLHANLLNGDALDAILAVLERRGFRFVTLEEALRDPAYESPDGYIGPHGPSWLRRWSIGLERPTRVAGQPDPPTWIMERYDRSR